MPEYINPNSYTVHLPGPDGKVTKVRGRAKVVLPEFFERYCVRGFIKRASDVHKLPPQSNVVRQKPIQSKLRLTRTAIRKHNRPSSKQPPAPQQIAEEAAANKASADRKKRKQEINKARRIARVSRTRRASTQLRNSGGRTTVVGKRLNIDATDLLKSNLEKNCFPISNNIGVGILSYNRLSSLRRLIDSILRHTDLKSTTVFISDDGSDDEALLSYLRQLDDTNNFVVLRNKQNLGIAGNSNRLIRCLSRFSHGIILNDDVEVLKNGWDNFYVDAMKKSKLHHLLYRQVGVYGAKLGDICNKNDVNLRKVDSRPHGAVMAFTREMLVKCGYFNEEYGMYGMEHVDWSQRAWEFGLQPQGFFDVDGSHKFFRINSDESAVPKRSEKLHAARKIFESRKPVRIGPTAASAVPSISYIIPVRDIQRNAAIKTVINNIRAQRFPVVHIIVVEQDACTRIKLDDFNPIVYYLARETQNPLFNKAIAFNLGVSKCTTNKLVLHDADMLTQGHYTKIVAGLLDQADACHLGGRVMYANQASTNTINKTGIVDHNVGCERVVGYFEGGSLACTKKTFWKVGGFNQDFWGYGCEDCDFYTRLSAASRWKEARNFDFLHLWHPRVVDWGHHHNNNKDIESRLKQLSINERVNLQYRQLKKVGYDTQLAESLT